jgi:hypothetical protein
MGEGYTIWTVMEAAKGVYQLAGTAHSAQLRATILSNPVVCMKNCQMVKMEELMQPKVLNSLTENWKIEDYYLEHNQHSVPLP